MSEKMKLNFEVSNYDILKDSDNLSLLRVKIVNVDAPNRNDTYFSTENVLKKVNTLLNKPIVAVTSALSSDGINTQIKGHELENPLDQKIIVGVVPESSFSKIESGTNEEGKEEKFLTTTIALFKMYCGDIVNMLKQTEDEGNRIKLSMEILVNTFEEMENGIKNIIDFSFESLCLLNNSLNCGISGAGGNFIKFEEDTKQIDKLEEYNKLVDESNEIIETFTDKANDNISKKEFTIDSSKLNFDINGMPISALQQKLRTSLDDFKIEEDDYQRNRYWIADLYVDEEKKYVIVEDCEDGNYYAVPYSIDEKNNVNLDVDNKIIVNKEYIPSGKYSQNNPDEMEEEKMDKDLKKDSEQEVFTDSKDGKNTKKGDEGKVDVKTEINFDEDIAKYDESVRNMVMSYRNYIKELELKFEECKEDLTQAKDFEQKYEAIVDEVKELRIYKDIKTKEDNITKKEEVFSKYKKKYTFTEQDVTTLVELKVDPSVDVTAFRAKISEIVEKYSVEEPYNPTVNLRTFSAMASVKAQEEGKFELETSVTRLLNASK